MDFMNLTNPDYAYMFGFLQTDGHLSWGVGLKGKLAVEIKREDEAILHEFKRLTPYYSSISRRERNTNFKEGYRSSTWTMSALEGRMRVLKLGLIAGRKSDWLAPPSVEHSESDYVRGLIDGDGSVWIHGARASVRLLHHRERVLGGLRLRLRGRGHGVSAPMPAQPAGRCVQSGVHGRSCDRTCSAALFSGLRRA